MKKLIIVVDGPSGVGKSSLHRHYSDGTKGLMPLPKLISGDFAPNVRAGKFAEQKHVDLAEFYARVNRLDFFWYQFSGNLYGIDSNDMEASLAVAGRVLVIVRDLNVIRLLRSFADENDYKVLCYFVDCPLEKRRNYILNAYLSNRRKDCENPGAEGPLDAEVEKEIEQRLSRDRLAYPKCRVNHPVYDGVITNEGLEQDFIDRFDKEWRSRID